MSKARMNRNGGVRSALARAYRAATVRKRLGPASTFRDFVLEWAGTILILMFGMTTLLQAYVVPTGSMETTILIGDHLLVDKLVYSPPGPISKHLLPYREVARGDVIVFRVPHNIRENYVKRVIGVPGDRIRIENKRVILNGRPVNEPYKRHADPAIRPYRDNFPGEPTSPLYPRAVSMLSSDVRDGELIVPPGQYFAMGDNRDESLDSRYWGFVPRENIIGKPLFVWWSYDAPTERLASGNVDPEHMVDIALHFFTKTRWDRRMKFVRAYPIP